MAYESEIEKGIPIPPPSHVGRPIRFPFAMMQVGDSIVMKMSYNKAKEITKYATRKFNMKFTLRTMPDKSGTRAWRVE